MFWDDCASSTMLRTFHFLMRIQVKVVRISPLQQNRTADHQSVDHVPLAVCILESGYHCPNLSLNSTRVQPTLTPSQLHVLGPLRQWSRRMHMETLRWGQRQSASPSQASTSHEFSLLVQAMLPSSVTKHVVSIVVTPPPLPSPHLL